jgi:hypothetical protein
VRSIAAIGRQLEAAVQGAESAPAELLRLGEEILEHWVTARQQEPTQDLREGFRLLALHRQGARGDLSFNACRETCRELVYHYNLLTMQPEHPDTQQRLRMMALVANHLFLFISGKMETQQLGEFCCSSKPLHAEH